MELVSLHPFESRAAEMYVQVLTGRRQPDPEWAAWWPGSITQDLSRAREGDETATRSLTFGLGHLLAQEHPVFTTVGFGLTAFEARVDRGIGMYMRPPARIFNEAGLERQYSMNMPIRLDLHQGMMGGAWIPAHLIGDVYEVLDSRMERMARRLREAEYDAVEMLGLMFEAVSYAREHNLGLYEAQDIVGPGGETVSARTVMMPDKKRLDPELRERLEEAAKPPKKPGLFARMFGRKDESQPFSSNGSNPG